MGRIYHLLLHDAKYLGTYYTSVPAANLLLKLVFSPDHWPDVDWSDIEHIKDLRVGDLACGTGTLLMAACQAITDNFVRARAANGEAIDQAKLRDLHQALMEEVMHGYDVLPSAIHLTASTLGLLAPEIAFQRMHLYSVPLGRSGRNEVLLGSLEYLRTERVFTQLNLMGEDSPTAAGQITGRGMMASAAPLPNLSICVMNPPFTRSVGNNLLFGSVPPGDRSAMQAKLRRMINPSSGIPVLANTTAGLGSVFAAVADRHIISGGRLALVLPAAITTGVAWKNTRELVASSYDLEAVIASHDADKWSFSENTNLSEVLLVARKRRSSTVNGESQTMCVNLWRNPTTSVEALAAAEAILHTVAVPIGEPEAPETAVAPLIVGAQKIGEVVSIPTGQLRGNPWLACAFAQTDLIRALFYLNRGVLFIPGNTRVWNVPICTLGDIAELGPDRRDIYDGFTLTDTPTPYSALWGHRADEMTTVAADPNRWLSPLNTARPNREL